FGLSAVHLRGRRRSGPEGHGIFAHVHDPRSAHRFRQRTTPARRAPTVGDPRVRPPDQDRTEETEDDLSRDERISEDEHLAELGIGSRIAPMPPGFDAGSEWSEPAPEAAPLEPAPPPTGDVEDQI